MPTYNTTPGVYYENVSSLLTIPSASTSVACFVGESLVGDSDFPTLYTSWNAFQQAVSLGQKTPFMKTSDLAYAVYSFFLNGGSQLRFLRVVGEGAKKATGDVGTMKVSATSVGDWGNQIKVTVTSNTFDPTKFDVTVICGQSEEYHQYLGATDTDENYFIDYINTYSKIIKVLSGTIAVTAETTLTGGANGNDPVDADYVKAFEKVDKVDDVTIFAVPGATTEAMLKNITSYLSKDQLKFGVLDAPKGYDADKLIQLRKKLQGRCVLVSSWHNVTDPLSTVNGKLRAIPSSGAYCGWLAKTQTEVGPWKDPAGTAYVIQGAISLDYTPNRADTDLMNPASIVSLVNKPNYGNIIWGARTLNQDSNFKYVSANMMDIFLRKSLNEGIEPLVFEPNKEDLWKKITVSCESFLDFVWRMGGLKGETAKEAYRVKCDAELNTEDVTRRGICITEVKYAYASPAEFIVIRLENRIPSDK